MVFEVLLSHDQGIGCRTRLLKTAVRFTNQSLQRLYGLDKKKRIEGRAVDIVYAGVERKEDDENIIQVMDAMTLQPVDGVQNPIQLSDPRYKLAHATRQGSIRLVVAPDLLR